MSSAPTLADFDLWRSAYATMTDYERRAWDARCFEHWPEQVHGSYERIRDFVSCGGSVVEVGGWRGDHAAMMLKCFPAITSWFNIEFCARAASSPKTSDPRYCASVPAEFRWWRGYKAPPADLLVMSHIIEHLSVDDLRALLGAVNHIPRAYVEAPLPTPGTDWRGYLGTHVLPLSWAEAEVLFEEAGYKVVRRDGDVREFAR